MYIGGDEVMAHVDRDERWFLQFSVSVINSRRSTITLTL